MTLNVLLEIAIPFAGVVVCAVVCVVVGRHYVRRCEESATYCAEVDERVDYLIEQVERGQRDRTEYIPRAGENVSPLSTYGQRRRADGGHTREGTPASNPVRKPPQS